MEFNETKQKRRKQVPRFRRKYHEKTDIDIDDREAQELIEEDLKSDFIWKTETTINDQESSKKIDFDFNSNNQKKNLEQKFTNEDEQIEINFNKFDLIYPSNTNQQRNHLDLFNEKIIDQYQIDLNVCLNKQFEFYQIPNDDNQENSIQWTIDDQNQYDPFSIINDNLLHSFDFQQEEEKKNENFFFDEQIHDQIDLRLTSNNENFFPIDETEILSIDVSSNDLAKENFEINFKENSSMIHLIFDMNDENNFSLKKNFFSISDQSFSFQYSINDNSRTQFQFYLDDFKSNFNEIHFDFIGNFSQRKSLLTFQEVLTIIYSINENIQCQYSIDNHENQQIYSIIDRYSRLNQNYFHHFQDENENEISFDYLLDQTSSLIYNFQWNLISIGNENEHFIEYSFLSKNEFKSQNFSPDEIILLNYSPDQYFNAICWFKQFENYYNDLNQRSFRRYRCKHLSIKTDQIKFNYDLNNSIVHQTFSFPMDYQEKFIDFDSNENSFIRELNQCYQLLLLLEQNNETFDYNQMNSNQISLPNDGYYILRENYQCQPPRTDRKYRQEIGWISFDASLENPIYYLNKSFKRYVHLRKEIENQSYSIYQGYQEFQKKILDNPMNYYRPFDSLDLRPLLYWYSKRQNLFSSTNSKLLKPPTFICRRSVLVKILSNLYCDSEPWKLLIIKIKGQYYLALANRSKRSSDDLNEDEYSGLAFESLMTTKQPNTTRFQQNFPLENPQQQFHTVNYWQFGKFNLLYSSEIDGEFIKQSKTQNDKDLLTKIIEDFDENQINQEQIDENIQLTLNNNEENMNSFDRNSMNHQKNSYSSSKFEETSGYVEMKCTNKKIFFRDENQLQTLRWWAQNWLANIDKFIIAYKTLNDGILQQIDYLSTDELVSKFLSKYDLRLKYCLSYLYSFLNLIEEKILIDDPNTVHFLTYLPQELEIDSKTGRTKQNNDLPEFVPFRYTQMKRSDKRHEYFLSQSYIDQIQRTKPFSTDLQDEFIRNNIDQIKIKRFSHRGRSSCPLKQNLNQKKKK